jgi:hypothetical protein
MNLLTQSMVVSHMCLAFNHLSIRNVSISSIREVPMNKAQPRNVNQGQMSINRYGIRRNNEMYIRRQLGWSRSSKAWYKDCFSEGAFRGQPSPSISWLIHSRLSKIHPSTTSCSTKYGFREWYCEVFVTASSLRYVVPVSISWCLNNRLRPLLRKRGCSRMSSSCSS